MAPAFRSRRQCDVLQFDREHLAAQEHDRGQGLISTGFPTLAAGAKSTVAAYMESPKSVS